MGKTHEERQLRKETSEEWAKLEFFARLERSGNSLYKNISQIIVVTSELLGEKVT